MARMKLRVSGAWVDSDRSGKVRYGGADVAFSPPAGASYEAVALGSPTTTDAQDGSQNYGMGMAFTLVASRLAHGVQWRVPDSLTTPAGGTHAIAIWNGSTEARIAYKEFTPTPGGLQDILFDATVALTSGVTYVAMVYTNKYVFKAGSPAGLTSPSGNIVAGAGRLIPYNGGAAGCPYPEDVFNSTYCVSPLVATS
jgi:hypothetical protein